MFSLTDIGQAVIFAGGTLSPTDDLAVQLLGDTAQRVACHQWDHVVPASHVLALSVPRGATGQAFVRRELLFALLNLSM